MIHIATHAFAHPMTNAADAPVASPPRVRDQPNDAQLDWHGTQLVVLSACETGVGVFGMRRAVTLAGAAAQVVSLWRADDGATRELMRALYRGLAGGAGRAEALRQAKLGLLHQPGYEHPYFWAAFVHAGDWRPLPAGTLRAP
jgi:CHAT domain-containing protein